MWRPSAAQVADKIVEVSASFGSDVWEAQNYGQVVYAIKTRNGQLYLKLLKRGGNMDVFEVGHTILPPVQPL